MNQIKYFPFYKIITYETQTSDMYIYYVFSMHNFGPPKKMARLCTVLHQWDVRPTENTIFVCAILLLKNDFTLCRLIHRSPLNIKIFASILLENYKTNFIWSPHASQSYSILVDNYCNKQNTNKNKLKKKQNRLLKQKEII